MYVLVFLVQKREGEELINSLRGVLGDSVVGCTFYDEVKDEIVWC